MGMIINCKTNTAHIKAFGKLSFVNNVSNTVNDDAALAILEKARDQIHVLDQLIVDAQNTFSSTQSVKSNHTNKKCSNFTTDQDQLEHILNMLATSKENLASTEFRIRDVEEAAKMTSSIKQSVLN